MGDSIPWGSVKNPTQLMAVVILQPPALYGHRLPAQQCWQPRQQVLATLAPACTQEQNEKGGDVVKEFI